MKFAVVASLLLASNVAKADVVYSCEGARKALYFAGQVVGAAEANYQAIFNVAVRSGNVDTPELEQAQAQKDQANAAATTALQDSSKLCTDRQ